MTQDEIIRMAREAGIQQRHATPTEWWCWEASIERFAALVAEREREVCAKEAEDFLTTGRSPLGRSVANAIRARNTQKGENT